MWKAPKLDKALARQIAKNVDKHWAVHVKSLGDIRAAIGKGVANAMSMRDVVDNQAAIKEWQAGLSKDDLHRMFRWVEEIKSGKANEQYRMTDDALRALTAATSKIASPRELQSELHRLLAYCSGPGKPSRAKLAAELGTLADRVESTEGFPLEAASTRVAGEFVYKLPFAFNDDQDSGSLRIFKDAVYTALNAYQSRFKGREQEVVNSFLSYDPYTVTDIRASRTAFTNRTASENALDYIVDQGDLGDIYMKLMTEDEQSAELLRDVYEKLGDMLKLSSGAEEALGRLRTIVRDGKSWRVDLLRNNVFKAAHALGMRLPSGSF